MNENQKRRLDIETNRYYIAELEAKINASRHYGEKVERSKTTDIHEKCRHLNNMGFILKKCLALHDRMISGESGNDLWKDTRAILNHAAYSIGEAATWLVGVAELPRKDNE
jgi:hypothetical protein